MLWIPLFNAYNNQNEIFARPCIYKAHVNMSNVFVCDFSLNNNNNKMRIWRRTTADKVKLSNFCVTISSFDSYKCKMRGKTSAMANTSLATGKKRSSENIFPWGTLKRNKVSKIFTATNSEQGKKKSKKSTLALGSIRNSELSELNAKMELH